MPIQPLLKGETMGPRIICFVSLLCLIVLCSMPYQLHASPDGFEVHPSPDIPTAYDELAIFDLVSPEILEDLMIGASPYHTLSITIITAQDTTFEYSIGPDHVTDSRDTNWLLTDACLRHLLAPPA